MIKWIKNSKYSTDIRLAAFYIKEYKRLFSLNVLIVLGIFLFEGAGVGLIIPIMQKFLGRGQENTFTQVTSTAFSYVHIEYTFLNVMIIFAFILMFKYGLTALQRYYTRVLCSTITYRLRKDSFENLMNLPIGYYYGRKLGDVIADVFTSSLNAGGLSQHVIDLIMAILFCFLYVSINFLISYKLMLVVLFYLMHFILFNYSIA
ncbi:MAG: Alpha-hemolysin translocation ATP-binding protein HlyB [Candidatus Scalindua rubra]|uniref:Alpha-hemolysin translocation ATP-binding protein HlyB n=1 Tax=Candidatus Scalindua rubra TaxID=1872076 RepID=A0A1E3XDQ7_9BACT|nr:MAG: Alpha-hemolysin translocation ATP-binding protein HlyB [Candidatus Scalindua rubra]